MSGNVWEWCEDYWHDSYKNAPSDGSAWLTKNDDNYHISHIIRGGCWGLDPGYCRSASRARSGGGFLAVSLGFRVVCVPTVTSTQYISTSTSVDTIVCTHKTVKIYLRLCILLAKKLFGTVN